MAALRSLLTANNTRSSSLHRACTMETYNASEGFFGIQSDPADKSMLLMLDYGIFYEFIPMDELGTDNPNIVPLSGVETGVNYAMVISSSCGLWRYMIGDTVTSHPRTHISLSSPAVPNISSMLSVKNSSWTMPKRTCLRLRKDWGGSAGIHCGACLYG